MLHWPVPIDMSLTSRFQNVSADMLVRTSTTYSSVALFAPVHLSCPHLSLSLCPPLFSCTAVLCPAGWGSGFVTSWRKLCRRAIAVLVEREVNLETAGVDSVDQWDLKGHVLDRDSSLACAYCVKCHTARQVKDAKCIPSHPCKGGPQVRIGDEVVIKKHVAKLEMVRWKSSSLHPRFSCKTCTKVWWAATTINECENAPNA